MLLRTYHVPNSVRILRGCQSLLMNYVYLEAGVPTRLHYTVWYFTVRLINDKESGKSRPIKSLVFWVDELGGEDVAKTHSIMSQKLLAHMIPWLHNKEFLNYDFIITKMGEGFYSDFNVQPIIRPDQIPIEERKENFDVQKLIEKLWNSI